MQLRTVHPEPVHRVQHQRGEQAGPVGVEQPRQAPADPVIVQRGRIAAELAGIDWALPGTITHRTMRCGKHRCHCHADPPQLHGPYIQWTQAAAGKTRTRLLTAAQLARYQPWMDNAARLRDLVHELEALTLHAVEHAEGWGDKN